MSFIPSRESSIRREGALREYSKFDWIPRDRGGRAILGGVSEKIADEYRASSKRVSQYRYRDSEKGKDPEIQEAQGRDRNFVRESNLGRAQSSSRLPYNDFDSYFEEHGYQEPSRSRSTRRPSIVSSTRYQTHYDTSLDSHYRARSPAHRPVFEDFDRHYGEEWRLRNVGRRASPPPSKYDEFDKYFDERGRLDMAKWRSGRESSGR